MTVTINSINSLPAPVFSVVTQRFSEEHCVTTLKMAARETIQSIVNMWNLFLLHIQVLALSVDLTNDAQDVENTLHQVCYSILKFNNL